MESKIFRHSKRNEIAVKMRNIIPIRTLTGLVLLLLTAGTRHASPLQNRPVAPTLARMSFWVPPNRMAEFEAAYAAKVVPIPKKHGLAESTERGRATVDSAFCKLFEVKTPSKVLEKQKALQDDSTWTAALRDLGRTFGTAAGPDSLIQNRFHVYAVPSGPGKVVKAGPGRTVPAGGGRGLWRTYDATVGLAASADVFQIFQDREGNLWFSTRGGVSRYDGQKITTFTTRDDLAHNWVNAILQDREGNLWFSTRGGVSRYDGRKITSFSVRDGLAHNWVNAILQDREGNLWFSTRGGVSRYDGRQFTTFTTQDGLVHNWVNRIIQDREGNLWFSTLGGVSRYDGRKMVSFTVRDGLPSKSLWSIFQDREGHLWFGSQDGGVSRYDGKGFTTFTTRDGLAHNSVNFILQDREGNLWFSTLGGVSRYDGRRFTTFTTKDGLAHNWVLPIFEDREGHLWFGTRGGGVSRYNGGTFTTFTARDGLAGNWVLSIFEDREGHLWFGIEGGGVSCYDGSAFATFTTENGLAADMVISIFEDREGHLWFGTGGGVVRYDGKTFTIYTTRDGLLNNYVGRACMQDRDGSLWFANGGGVSRLDGRSWVNFTREDLGGYIDARWEIQDREGYPCFMTTVGPVRYDGRAFVPLTPPGSLAGKGIMFNMLQDREGNLWLGSRGSGVSRYDGKTFTNFTTQDGLAGDEVWSLFQDREGILWFGTMGGGVSRYDGQVFQALTRQDGLGANSNWVYTIFQDRKGYLWFGTYGGGVTRYRKPGPVSPPAFIDAVVADQRYEKVSDLRVPSSVKLTAFEFHGMSFKTRPEAMVYRYRLRGYDKDWKTTHDRRVEYQDLPIGTYTFEVQAVDRDLVYSEKPATVTLRVHLPYERIGWMSALGIAVALVVWQTARVVRRDRRLREANTALSSANKDLFGVNRELQQTLKEKEEAQQQLIQAERMAAVGELVAGSAHELNNPMAVASSMMQSVAEIVKEDTLEELAQDRDMVIQNLQVGLKDLNRAKDIVSSLLSLSDRTRDYTEAVQVNIVADDALRMLKGRYDEAKVQIVKDYAENLPLVTGSFADLGQMAMHIVRNAIEAIKGSGTITLKTYGEDNVVNREPGTVNREEDDDGSRITDHGSRGGGERAEWVVFECQDTGAGISPEIREDIFKPFFKTKPPAEGTGLGLYICHEIVKKHGGEIAVESEVGRGTTFKVRLPVRKEQLRR